jgi:hypothetical protein
MKRILIVMLILLSAGLAAQNQSKNKQLTWTYTYLKAQKGEKENLRKYISLNWFAMDSIAVRRGLFRDYRLLENQRNPAESNWDFIVAVEYFTRNTYLDIQEEWTEMRNNHKEVLINDKGLSDLGKVVDSQVLFEANKPSTSNCYGTRSDGMSYFIGNWKEYLVTDEGEQLYGHLTIEWETKGCGIRKKFEHLLQDFQYSTLGYYDSKSASWVETYLFSNGSFATYRWTAEGGDQILTLESGSFTPQQQTRNRWKIIDADQFQIITEEFSSNEEWKVLSITNLKRIAG